MKIGICPGSFDPVTNGHVDIFERGAKLVDKLVVAVFVNPNKNPMFTMQERVELLKSATAHIPNVEVDSFSGLLHTYVREHDSQLIIRGLRAFSDFEYEFQRALLIKSLDPQIETAFIMTSGEYSFLSSSGVRELAVFGGEIDKLVPPCVSVAIQKKQKQIKNKE